MTQNECKFRKAWVKCVHKSFVKKIGLTYAIIDLTKVGFFTRSDRKIGLATIKPFDSFYKIWAKYNTTHFFNDFFLWCLAFGGVKCHECRYEYFKSFSQASSLCLHKCNLSPDMAPLPVQWFFCHCIQKYNLITFSYLF